MPIMQQMEPVLPMPAVMPGIVKGEIPGQLPKVEPAPVEEIKVLAEDEDAELPGETPVEVEPVVLAEPVVEPKVLDEKAPAQVPEVKAEPAPVEAIKVAGEDDDTDLFGAAPQIGQPEAPVADNAMAALQQLFGEGGKLNGMHDVLETFAKLFESLANLDKAGEPAAPAVAVEPVVEPVIEVDPVDMVVMDPPLIEPPQQPGMIEM